MARAQTYSTISVTTPSSSSLLSHHKVSFQHLYRKAEVDVCQTSILQNIGAFLIICCPVTKFWQTEGSWYNKVWVCIVWSWKYRHLLKTCKKQLSTIEVETARKLSQVRIHMEQVIGTFKQKYTMFQSTLPTNSIRCDQDTNTSPVVSCADVFSWSHPHFLPWYWMWHSQDSRLTLLMKVSTAP